MLERDDEDDFGWCTFFDRKSFLAIKMAEASPTIAMKKCTAGSLRRSTMDKESKTLPN
jgi:hypothetical protein